MLGRSQCCSRLHIKMISMQMSTGHACRDLGHIKMISIQMSTGHVCRDLGHVYRNWYGSWGYGINGWRATPHPDTIDIRLRKHCETIFATDSHLG